MTDGLHIEVTLPGPVDDVWPLLRDPGLVRSWFGWEHDQLQDEIREIFVDGTDVEPDGRSLHVGGHRFTFAPHGPQTVVRVTRAAPRSDDGMDWDAWYDDVDEGWLTFLHQLRFALDRQPGATRRTVHLAGATATPTTAAAALGIDVDAPVGAPYSAVVAGEPLAGEVWFRSAHQLGLTVDGWGPGLLVLADAPNAGGTAASATLSTYGPIDGDLEARWRGAWEATYAD